MLPKRRPRADPQSRKRLTAALRAQGYQPIGTRSRLYEALELEIEGKAPFTYFVGRDGELRMSRTGRLSDSISLRGLDAYDALLDQGRAILEEA